MVFVKSTDFKMAKNLNSNLEFNLNCIAVILDQRVFSIFPTGMTMILKLVFFNWAFTDIFFFIFVIPLQFLMHLIVDKIAYGWI